MNHCARARLRYIFAVMNCPGLMVNSGMMVIGADPLSFMSNL